MFSFNLVTKPPCVLLSRQLFPVFYLAKTWLILLWMSLLLWRSPFPPAPLKILTFIFTFSVQERNTDLFLVPLSSLWAPLSRLWSPPLICKDAAVFQNRGCSHCFPLLFLVFCSTQRKSSVRQHLPRWQTALGSELLFVLPLLNTVATKADVIEVDSSLFSAVKQRKGTATATLPLKRHGRPRGQNVPYVSTWRQEKQCAVSKLHRRFFTHFVHSDVMWIHFPPLSLFSSSAQW